MPEPETTTRYARRTIEITGLAQGKAIPEAKKVLAEDHGILWDLTGSDNPLLEAQTVNTKTWQLPPAAEGVHPAFPSSLSAREREGVVEMLNHYGIEVGYSITEQKVVADLPYIEAPLRLGIIKAGEVIAYRPTLIEWSEGEHKATIRFLLSRAGGKLTVKIEGDSADSVSNPTLNGWINRHISNIRSSLAIVGLQEKEVAIDCEVILGAERSAACDPDMMKAMLNNDDQEEEE